MVHKKGRLELGGRLLKCGISICMALLGGEWCRGDGGSQRGLYAGARPGRFRPSVRRSGGQVCSLLSCSRDHRYRRAAAPAHCYFPFIGRGYGTLVAAEVAMGVSSVAA